MIPAGSGRCLVLSILASMSRSWYWLRADAPQARRKTAAAGTRTSMFGRWEARKKPAAAEQAAKREMETRQSVKYGFKDDIVIGRSNSCKREGESGIFQSLNLKEHITTDQHR